MWRPIKLPDFRFNPAVRSLAVAACIVGYALLVHHVNATGQVSALGAVLALLPVAALGVTLLRNPTSRNAGLMLVLVAGLALLSPLANALAIALQDEADRMAAVTAFAVTAIRGAMRTGRVRAAVTIQSAASSEVSAGRPS